MKGRENRGDGRRIPRVEKEIREAVGTYLITGFRGEIDGIVSITRVIASKDLRNAKVLFSLMGSKTLTAADKKAAARELMDHVHEIQHEVNRRLQMKHCPRLTFLYDEGYEHALKVENILRDLSEERKRKEKESGGESES